MINMTPFIIASANIARMSANRRRQEEDEERRKKQQEENKEENIDDLSV